MAAPVAVVGATGYTGRLIVDQLLDGGRDIVAVGRNPEKLDALPGGVTPRVADAQDAEALAAALKGCAAAVSCVGPFVDLGETPLRTIVGTGLHYLDTTGEQAFMRRVFERYDSLARERGIAAVTAMGFDYVPGDMAAAIAADGLGRTPEVIEVYYSVRRAKASDGTKRTGARVMAHPCLVWREGALREVPVGSEERDVELAGEATHVALWPGGEVITVPRHTEARNVTVFMRMPRAMAKMARGARLAAPLSKPAEKLIGSSTGGPSASDRRRAHYTVVAEARAGTEVVRCVVEGRDMYGVTAACCVEALRRMDGSFDRTGALAPAEAFEPRSFLDALVDWLSWRLERP